MDLLQWFFLIVSPIILLVVLIKLTRKGVQSGKQKQNLPPRAPGLPIIGNLLQLSSLQHRSLGAISKKYGPIMLMYWGSVPVVVVSSVELATEILKEQSLAFSNRPYAPYQRRFLGGRTTITFATYGEEWRQGRNTSLAGMLNPKKVGSFAPDREHEVAMMVEKVSQSCSLHSPINLTKMLLAFSYNILSKGVTGRDSEREDVKSFGKVVLDLLTQVMPAAFFVGDYFPWLAWVDTVRGASRNLDKFSIYMETYIDKLLEQHPSEQGSPDQNKNLVDHLLLIHKDNLITRENVKAMIVEMFLATDMVSSIMEWVMSHLIKNRSQMKKVQEEVRRVVGTKSKIAEDDIKHMKHMNCIIKETLRLHPPAPLLPRVTSADTSLGGYHIPANTAVYINVWEMQRDPKLWDSPHEFIPERFNNTHIDYKGLHQELIPFGSGRRGCPGMMYGMAFIDLAIANLLCWFDWELPEVTNMMDMEEDLGISLVRKNPLLLIPTLRAT